MELIDVDDFEKMSLNDQQKYISDIITLLPDIEKRYFVDVISDMINNEEPWEIRVLSVHMLTQMFCVYKYSKVCII